MNCVQQWCCVGKDYVQGGGDEQDIGNQQCGVVVGRGDYRRYIIFKVINEGGYDSGFVFCLN